jgi:hypothetical protein
VNEHRKGTKEGTERKRGKRRENVAVMERKEERKTKIKSKQILCFLDE